MMAGRRGLSQKSVGLGQDWGNFKAAELLLWPFGPFTAG